MDNQAEAYDYAEEAADRNGPQDRDPWGTSSELTKFPCLSWDDSVVTWPLTVGADAEPRVIDWDGEGQKCLLVTSKLGPEEYRTLLFRRLTAEPEGSSPDDQRDRRDLPMDAGRVLPELDGLRFLCPIPAADPQRFDLVALDPQIGLVVLHDQGPQSSTRFGPPQFLGITPDLFMETARITHLSPVDWDGDGLTDILVGYDDMEGYWPDAESGLWPTEQVGFNLQGGHPGYNEGGQWRGKLPRGLVTWLRNIGQPGRPAFQLQDPIVDEDGSMDVAYRVAPLAASWNGGGATELLLTDAEGSIKLFRNFGGQLPPVLMDPRRLKLASNQEAEQAQLPADRTTLEVADLDGDRRPELIYGTAEGGIQIMRTATGRDRAKPASVLRQIGSTMRLGGQVCVSVFDLDEDQDADLILGTATGRILWVEDRGKPGDPRYTLPVPIESLGESLQIRPGPDGMISGPAEPELGYACPIVYDWSDHGRPDILISGASGELTLVRNNGAAGQPRFDAPRPIHRGSSPMISPPRVRPAVADLEGDGQISLITLNLYGFLTAYPRISSDQLGPGRVLTDLLGRPIKLDGGFAWSGRCSLWAGPWTDGDGDDILVGLPKPNRHVLWPLLGMGQSEGEILPSVFVLIHQGEGRYSARPLYDQEGEPIVIGQEGCHPNGLVNASGSLDLLVGSDEGTVHRFDRHLLIW